MSRHVDREVLIGFIEEVKGYLPLVLRGIEAFRVDPSEVEKIEEAHRYIHTIKGASSMVGFSSLSHIAYQFEECLEDVAAGRLSLTSESIVLFVNLLAEIEQYLDSALEDTKHDASLLIEATRTIRRLRSLPESEDDAVLQELLSQVNWDQNEELIAGPEIFGDLEAGGSTEELQAAIYHEAINGGDVSSQGETAGTSTTPSTADIPNELAEIFAMEAEDHLRNMSMSLPALEQDPSNKDLLQGVRRSAHSLKGTAAMVGFQEITSLAHRMEDLLDLLYDGELKIDTEIMGLLYASTYALEDMAGGKTDSNALGRLYSAYSSLLDGRPEPTLEEAEALLSAESETVQEEIQPVPQVWQLNTDSLEGRAEELLALAKPEPDIPLAQPSQSETQSVSSATAHRRGQVVRVPIERLDELVRLVSELVITRSSFEQSQRELAREVTELLASSERLKRVSSKIETEYEASTLGGARPWMPGPAFSGTGNLGSQFPFLSSLPTAQNSYGFDDLEFDRYTEFHLMSREVSETTTDIQSIGDELNGVAGDFDSYMTRQGRLYSEIQDKLMRIRMVPLSTLSSRLHRTVRTVAEKQGKRVELILEGDNTELDKTVLEEMSDPLLHLLRNSVDHGIESVSERVAKGKPANGTIKLSAYNEGTQIVIRIEDDGAGLNPEAIREAAVRNGYASATVAAEMSQQELVNFLFHPGFSTRSEVSEVSGRGVGLDIVKATVHKLKGSIIPDWTPGKGTAFTIRLPMTLAIARALLVKAHGDTFAIPIGAITQILRLESENVEENGSEMVVRVGERVYPVRFLGKTLGLKKPAEQSLRRPPVMILSVEGRQVALVVDQLIGGREIAVKNLGSHLKRVPCISGATLMGDGTVVLILNPSDLVKETVQVQPRVRRATGQLVEADKATLNVMVVDDSPSVRRIVSNLIKAAGWKPLPAKDGLEALELLHASEETPDVVLLDIEMPRMDGYELLSTLRAQSQYRDLPVVMLTSRAGDKHRKKAFDLGATEYLVKPYTDETLLDLVKRLGKARR